MREVERTRIEFGGGEGTVIAAKYAAVAPMVGRPIVGEYVMAWESSYIERSAKVTVNWEKASIAYPLVPLKIPED